MAAVRIPPTLRAEVGGLRELEVGGDTVGAVIEDLVERYPALADQLYAGGELASFVNVYLGGEDIRTLDGLETPVYESETVILLPAMAGGASVDDQPVPVDHLHPTRAAGDLILDGRGDSLAEHRTAGLDELDRVSGLEAALAANDADSQQTSSVLRNRPPGAFVDVEPRGGRLAEPKP